MTDPAVPDVAGDWFAAMRRGEWEAAWRATDRIELPRRQLQRRPGFRSRPEYLRWDGTPLAGRVVLVRCEHGLGDTLQFMRFIPHLGARHVHFMVQPALVNLLRDAPGLADVRNYWTDDPLPPHDVDIEVMELAYAMRSTLSSLPPPYPHLRGQLPRTVELLAADEPGLRVGLLWAASDWDRTRSLGVEMLAPLFGVPGVRFFSLQQGPAANDPLLASLPIERLSSRTQAVESAAAAMCQLDLVITVDGMPAHLAATLARPTWILLKHEADWRWMDEREDTPWYPTVRLLRQAAPGDWSSVIRHAAASLRDVAQAHRRRQAVSPEPIGR